MKSRAKLAILLPVLAFTAFAADPFAGTWKLDPSRSSSTFGPEGAPRAGTLSIEVDKTTIITKGTVTTNKNEEKTVEGTTYRLDGKEHGVPGAESMTVMARRLNDHTLQFVFTGKDGLSTRRTMVVSPNGKMLTSVTIGTNAAGRDFASYSLYERE